LTDDQVASLPVDDLALEVLRDVVVNLETCNTNSATWIAMAAQTNGPEARHGLSEVWGWLYTNGPVANDLERHTMPMPS
jgi:hypothetical protein